MEEEIMRALKEYGLDEKEAAVFLYLVYNNRITAYKVAKETRIHKSTCYDVLRRLIEKGFVAKSGDGDKTIYFANDITEILGILKTKEELLLSTMPKIKALESREKTFVKQIDSESSFLGINSKIAELAKNGELTFVYMLGNNPQISTKSSVLLIDRLLHELNKHKIKNKVDCRGLWDLKFRKNEFMLKFNKLGENKFTALPSQVTTIIFDGHVVFFFIEDKPNVVEIKNKKISGEMKAYFEQLWRVAKP